MSTFPKQYYDARGILPLPQMLYFLPKHNGKGKGQVKSAENFIVLFSGQKIILYT